MQCFVHYLKILCFISVLGISATANAASVNVFGLGDFKEITKPSENLSSDIINMEQNYYEEIPLVINQDNAQDETTNVETNQVDNIANAFVIISAMLVIIMSVPGIGLFYGGLVRAKNVMSVLAQCLVIFCLSMLLWMILGYSLAFSPSNSFMGPFVGSFDKFLLLNISVDSVYGSLSEYAFIIFQGAFCAISACLIVGALVERINFNALMFIISFWIIFSYVPLAHMVWGGGFIDEVSQAYDFAGGTVVHINAAIAALIGAKMLGSRYDLNKIALPPHNLTITYVGCGFLWFGWFGFNAGSQLNSDAISALAFLNTVLTPAAAAITWIIGEIILNKKASALGAVSGVLAGLVAITPACAYVGPLGGVIIGIVSSIVCLWGVRGFKRITKIDDSLDVFGIHGLGAIVGALLTGVFCSPSLGGTGFKGDHLSILSQFYGQFISVVVAIIWSAIVSYIAFSLAKVIFKSIRVSLDEERMGLDLAYHGERGYNI